MSNDSAKLRDAIEDLIVGLERVRDTLEPEKEIRETAAAMIDLTPRINNVALALAELMP